MAFIQCKACGERTTDKRDKCKCGAPILSPAQKALEADNKRWRKNEELHRWAQADKKKQKTKAIAIHCPNCKYEGAGQQLDKGNGWIELALWLFTWWTFLVIPVLYSIWRRTGERPLECPVCRWQHVVPLNRTPSSTPDPDDGQPAVASNEKQRVVPLRRVS